MIKMPWTSPHAPHFILEINQRCNISCRGCYKKLDGPTKSLDQIFEDLEKALSLRRIQTVSIGGGEPTLHPQLCDIVSYIHKKKLKVSLITNGLALDDSLLEQLKKAGLDVIMFHIDEGQNRPDLPKNPTIEEVNSLRTALTKRAAEKRIDIGLSVTIYSDYINRLPDLINYILSSDHINFFFGTNYVDINKLVKHSCAIKQNKAYEAVDLEQVNRTTNKQIEEVMKANFDLNPFAYLPSDNKNSSKATHLTWMTYFVPVIYNGNSFERFNMEANFIDAFLINLSRLITGKFMFYFKHSPVFTGIRILCNAVTTRQTIKGIKFLLKLKNNGNRLRAKRLLFENGPIVTKEGEISCCYFCPEATIRDNKLVHVCLADHVHIEGA